MAESEANDSYEACPHGKANGISDKQERGIMRKEDELARINERARDLSGLD